MRTISFIQLLKDYNVVIPPIQRDYAQGRQIGKIPYIRNRFLNSIFDVLSKKTKAPLNLDFIYGYIVNEKRNNDEIETFKPLDGQQRLTTLFLIHWYVLHKEIKSDEILIDHKKFLKNFSYTTRNSSRYFCDKLVEYNPSLGYKSLSEEIEDQPWFFSSWRSDPTISSMLVVLDAIEVKYDEYISKKVSSKESLKVWDNLVANKSSIVFHLLPMDDLGLPDDLYIKMNSRGKELTDFEHFKSSFTSVLDEGDSKYFSEKVDKEWSDLFWRIFKDKESKDVAKIVDEGFISFFWFITNILIVKQDITFEDDFWIERAKHVYKGSKKNIQFLFNCIELFEGFEKNDPNYFERLFYIESDDFKPEKTRLFFGKSMVNLFHKCASTYLKGGFVIREQVLLYSFIQIRLNDYRVPKDFYRLTRNLLEHAADKEIRNEKLNTLYKAIDDLINGVRNYKNLPFTKRQINEEKLKQKLISNHESLINIIYKLDDHTLLRGNISIFDFDEKIKDYGKVFLKIFNNSDNDYFQISRAMLTIGDYSRSYGKYYKRFGNKNDSVWREIFTESDSRKGFENTKTILKEYLNQFLKYPKKENNDLINSFLNEYTINPNKPKELRYYIIKYDSFIKWGNNNTQGYYYFKNHTKPYECLMMFKVQFNGRHWSPFLLELTTLNDECSLENYGNDMQFTKGELILKVKNINSGFQFMAPENDHLSENYIDSLIKDEKLSNEGILVIKQNKHDLDLEDRIEKLNNFLNNLEMYN